MSNDMNPELLTQIEATLTFADGETVSILLGNDADSAWGNFNSVLARSVPVREAIRDALREAGLLATEAEEAER